MTRERTVRSAETATRHAVLARTPQRRSRPRRRESGKQFPNDGLANCFEQWRLRRRNRHEEREAQRDEYSADKPGYALVCPIAQCPLALQDEPSRAEQGITEHQADPGQH